MKFSIASILAAAAAVMAYTTPVGEPDGPNNAIGKPGLQEQVPAGKPFTITWAVSRPEVQTVTLLLLRGPGDNIKFHSVIVEKTPNTGSFVWTPSTSLENDVTHYGIQLIQDVDGKYQYSTQFGIENKNPTPSSSTTATSTTTTVASSTTTVASSTSTSTKITTSTLPGTTNSTLSTSTTTSTSSSTELVPSPSVTPSGNGTVPVPSSSPTPSSTQPITNQPGSAAGRTIASLGMAGALAVLVGLAL